MTTMKKNAAHADILATADKLRWKLGDNFHDSLLESIYQDAAEISDKVVTQEDDKPGFVWDAALDRILTRPVTGLPIMLFLLMLVFWVTISGANVPSGMLASLLVDTMHPILKSFVTDLGVPAWINGLFIDGMYLAMAWVIAVMLPPMAIFFPIFTLLEDFGYLPRVAFNMDKMFRKVGAHGKQALTMAMGYGCNAAGVVATRIIDSPRERLIAIITNNFSLCNGRWPTQILIATLFIGSLVPPFLAGFVSAMSVVAISLLGIVLTFVVSWALSKTYLKGEVSSFTLELPPYRPPRLLQTLYTSLIDRTIFVLWRAIIFAIPAGALIWLVSNVNIGDQSLAEHIITFSDPFAFLIGLNGVIILAYLVAIPANEIVIPTILMLTILTTKAAGVGEGAGVMFEFDDMDAYTTLFSAGGWTLLTAINLMLFSLVHNPCSTTIYTIYKETKSIKWTLVSTFLPVIMGLIICFIVAQLWRIFA